MHQYSEGLAIAVLFSSFFIFMIIRVPIAFSLILSSIAAAVYMQLPIMVLARVWRRAFSPWPLTIPLFILAGEIMSQEGFPSGWSLLRIPLSDAFGRSCHG